MSLLFLTILGPLLTIVYCSNKDLCPTGTKLFQHKGGSLECLVCSHCPRGKVKVANCSVDSDTICEPCDDYSYYNDKEPHCRPCTVCSPGEFTKRPCDQFWDSDCEPCPNGTFSSRQNSSSCTNCSVCTDGHYTECNKTHNAICNQTSKKESGPAGIDLGFAIAVPVGMILMLFILVCIYRKRQRCWSKQDDTEEKDRDISHRKFERRETVLLGPANNNQIEKHTEPEPVATINELEVNHLRKEAKEKTNFGTAVTREPVPANEMPVENHTGPKSSIKNIKELREKQMEREYDIRNLTVSDQLHQLFSSVGELVSSKPTTEGTSKIKQDNSNLAVCFVGSKYIMTAYFPVRDICGITGKNEINHSRFDDHDVYVTFGTNTFSKKKFKIRATTPAYTNTLLDIIVLEIYPSFETATAETRKEMSVPRSLSNETENDEDSSHFPPSFCLHTSIPIGDVQYIHIILFDKAGNIVQNRLNNLLKNKTESLKKAFEYLSDNADILERFGENKDLLKYSKRELADVGKTKVCWTYYNSNATCVGSPGFILDPRDGCCRLLCICTGKVPKIIDDLPFVYRKHFVEVKCIRTGTLMSEVYKKIKRINPDLAKDLFNEFDGD